MTRSKGMDALAEYVSTMAIVDLLAGRIVPNISDADWRAEKDGIIEQIIGICIDEGLIEW